MEVCEICGCFLIVGDAQQRIDEHFVGKQHVGFAKIKATIEEMEVTDIYFKCYLCGYFRDDWKRKNCSDIVDATMMQHRNAKCMIQNCIFLTKFDHF